MSSRILISIGIFNRWFLYAEKRYSEVHGGGILWLIKWNLA
jgi:hypothetical protein